jgi:hypothetical protein
MIGGRAGEVGRLTGQVAAAEAATKGASELSAGFTASAEAATKGASELSAGFTASFCNLAALLAKRWALRLARITSAVCQNRYISKWTDAHSTFTCEGNSSFFGGSLLMYRCVKVGLAT